MANYKAVTSQAQQTAATPYQAYGGDLVAGVNGQQTSGINAVNNASGIQNPYNAGATGLAAASSANIDPTKFSAAQLQQYENPYQQSVIDATMAQIRNQNQQQAADLQGNAVSAGAFGGDRAGVAQAALAGQQGINNNATLAGLNTSNFQNAQGEFNTQQGVGLSAAQNTAARQLAASQQIGNLGQTAQTEALTGANAQVNAGTLEQQTTQAQDTAAYNQFLQKQAYPFQTTGWLANIVEGIGSQSGGTSTGQQTTQGGSGASQAIGAGLGLASMFLNRGGRVDEIRVPHKAGGGGLVPYDAVSPSAGLGAGSYVIPANLAVGHTMPQGGLPSAPAASNAGQGMAQAAKGVQGLGNAFQNSAAGDAVGDFLQDSFGLARGGVVRPHFDGGGDVTPDALWADAVNPHGDAPALPPREVTPLTRAADLPTYAQGLAARYANQMPAPQQDGFTPQQRLAVAMGNPLPQSGDTPPPDRLAEYDYPTADSSVLAGMPQAVADRFQDAHQDYMNDDVLLKRRSDGLGWGFAPAGLAAAAEPDRSAGLAKLGAAMGATPTAPRDPNAVYGGLGDAANLPAVAAAPLPPSRPAGLGAAADNSLDAVAPGGFAPSARIAAAPTQLVGAGLASAEANAVGERPHDMWAAPAYRGPAPTGPAPDPSNYPVTQAGQTAFIRDYSAYAGGRGIDPNFAIGVGNAEGLRAISPSNPNGASVVDIDPATGKPYSFGAFQLNVRNGLGNAARAAGIDPTDPAQANAANKFAMDYMATHDIRPWRSDKAVEAYQSGQGLAAGAAPAPSAYSGAPLTASSPVASTDANPNNGGGLLGLHLSDAARQGMLAAGLGMMGGSSMNPWINIGQGGQQGLAAYNNARKLQSEIGLQGAQAGRLNTETGLLPMEKTSEANLRNAQAGLVGGQAGGVDIENKIKQNQLDLMNGILGKNAAASSQRADAVAANPSATVARNGPATEAPKTVDTRSDPFALRAEADRLSLGGPMFKERADRMYAQAAAIMSGEQQVQFTDGSTGYYPGIGEAKARQASAMKTAENDPAIALHAGEKNFDTQNGYLTSAASEAENGQNMKTQALALRNLMFDPKTGKPLVNSGPYGEHIAGIAATMKQLGVGDSVIAALTGTDPNNAQSIEKLRTALGSESARADLANSQVRVAEFQRFLASTPSASLLPEAYKFIIDKAILPKAEQQIQEYRAVQGLDPKKDDVRGKLFEYRQSHPWYAGAPPANPADRVKDTIYANPQGARARWSGTGWVPVQ